MKTDEGWIRGKRCGKSFGPGRVFVCAMCVRMGDEKADLCFPVATGALLSPQEREAGAK